MIHHDKSNQLSHATLIDRAKDSMSECFACFKNFWRIVVAVYYDPFMLSILPSAAQDGESEYVSLSDESVKVRLDA